MRKMAKLVARGHRGTQKYKWIHGVWRSLSLMVTDEQVQHLARKYLNFCAH